MMRLARLPACNSVRTLGIEQTPGRQERAHSLTCFNWFPTVTQFSTGLGSDAMLHFAQKLGIYVGQTKAVKID